MHAARRPGLPFPIQAARVIADQGFAKRLTRRFRSEGHATKPALTQKELRRRLIAPDRASTASSASVCQDSPQAHADRWRRLPPRSPSRARPTGRSRPERNAHHGIEKRTSAHARRYFKRKNGCFWRAQFCTEVAHPTRFERVTFAFGGQR